MKSQFNLNAPSRNSGSVASAALVVDGPNFCHLLKGLSANLDYAKFHDVLEQRLAAADFGPIRIASRTLVSPPIDWNRPNACGLFQFHQTLRKYGWIVAYADAIGQDDDKAIEIACFFGGLCDVIILGTGDGHFLGGLWELQVQGKPVVVVSSNHSVHYGCSYQLQTYADYFVEVANLPCVRTSFSETSCEEDQYDELEAA